MIKTLLLTSAVIGALVIAKPLQALEKEIEFSTQKSTQPNIVVLFADDAGYADFGFQGSNEMITPHLDALASNGVRFKQAYVTDATCGPSRAGLLTGRYQQRFGFEENNVPGYMSANSAKDGADMGIPVSIPTIGDYLQKLGYATAFYGKWHVGGADKFHPLNRGFDEFYGFRGGARSYFAYAKDAPTHLDWMERGLGEYQEHEGYLTDVLADEAINFIEKKAKAKQPFFAFVSFNAVHTPMDAKPEDLALFPELKGKRQTVAAMTYAMDKASGRIMQTLKDLNIDKNTLVIFTNDNGGPTDRNASSNAPLSGSKSNHFEGGIRVPFIMQWPEKIAKASVYDYPISTLDLLPTIYRAAQGNEQTLVDIDGVDLMPYIQGSNSERPHDVLYWKKDVRGTIRVGDWKMMRFPDRPAQLYHVPHDVHEEHDLAAKHPELVQKMFKKLFEWESTLERPRWLLQRKFENYDIERMDTYLRSSQDKGNKRRTMELNITPAH